LPKKDCLEGEHSAPSETSDGSVTSSESWSLIGQGDSQPKCYVPNTVFRRPDGHLLLVQHLKKGSEVLLNDGKVACVSEFVEYPWCKDQAHELRVLSTSQGRFEVSADHRIGVPDGECSAKDLHKGDLVLVGQKKQPLTDVTVKYERIPLYAVTFIPDGLIEARHIAPFGLQTFGEPPVGPQGTWHLLHLMGLGDVTEAELQKANSERYVD